MNYRIIFGAGLILSLSFFGTDVGGQSLPTLSMSQLTSDADVVAENVNYLYAINWNNAAITVNGIDFASYNGRSAVVGTGGYTFMSSKNKPLNPNGGSASKVGLDTAGTGAGLNSLLTGFIYYGGETGDTGKFTFGNNLVEGKTYTLRYFLGQWDGGKQARTQTFYFDSNLDGIADEFQIASNPGAAVTSYTHHVDQPVSGGTWAGATASAGDSSPYAIDYTFVAGSNTLPAYFNVETDHGFHQYALALYEHADVARVMAAEATVKNGSFEVDTYYAGSDNHGYVSSNNGILSGWVVNNTAKVGLAPSWTSLDRATRMCGDFLAATINVPHGGQAVFLQSHNSDETTTIQQEITGFAPGADYILSFHSARRGGTGGGGASMNLTSSIIDSTGTTMNSLTSLVPDANFTMRAQQFTATDAINTLQFAAVTATGADGSALIDDVKLWRMSQVFNDNFAVQGNSQSISESANDLPGRFTASFAGPYNYIEKRGSGGVLDNPQLHQVGHPDAYEGTLMFATGVNSTLNAAGVTLDYDFNNFYNAEEGTMFHIEFSTAPFYKRADGVAISDDLTAAVNNSWTGVMFGASDETSNWVVSSDGFGVLVRKDGGVQIFHEGATLFSGNQVVASADGWYDFDIYFLLQENEQSGRDADVGLYINGDFIYGFSATDDFLENYISFMANTDGGATGTYYYSAFDNFSVSASGLASSDSAVPEPATWAMLLVGLAGMAVCRFRRKR